MNESRGVWGWALTDGARVQEDAGNGHSLCVAGTGNCRDTWAVHVRNTLYFPRARESQRTAAGRASSPQMRAASLARSQLVASIHGNSTSLVEATLGVKLRSRQADGCARIIRLSIKKNK